MKKLSLTAAAAALSALSYGAGFQVLEQGAANMGTAMAGAVVNANNDASAAFENISTAAFMPLEEGETSVSASISMVYPTLGLTSDSGGDYDCAVDAYVPNFFLVHKFTDDISAGFSVTAPFGLESKYDSDWIGKAQSIHSFLLTTDINPSVSYKITDWLSIGLGVSAQYAYCKLTQFYTLAGAELDLRGHSWGVGGNAGFTVQYAEDGRFGFQWRSAVEQNLDGNARLGGSVIKDIKASVSMPDTFIFGAYQRLRGDFKSFAVMADYSYTRWSLFEELNVQGIGTSPEQWKDTSRVSAGMHYYPEMIKDLTVRFGACYDESPVTSAEMRTVRIPCSDRIWFAGGLGYTWEDITFDVSYAYIFTIGNSDINRTEYGTTVTGEYYGHIHVISMQVGFKF